MKDNFSTQSQQYLKFRPGYPQELFAFLEGLLPEKKTAWDCGTGNGQVAVELAKFMQKIYATDISRQQLQNAIQKENIIYSEQPAERTNFKKDQFDLVTVAQAVHWFNFKEFYKEVRRVLKPGGIIAVIGYGLLRINEHTDAVIDHFYMNIVGSYWDEERKYLDEKYQTIPFPFNEIPSPGFENKLAWELEHLIGYLKTWSAVKHYQKDKGHNPVDRVYEDLKRSFEKKGTVTFPVLLRVGMKR